jgi:hypothetical protein
MEVVDAQRNTRWQQEIAYTMDIQVDAEAHQYTGTQEVIYTNNSPEFATAFRSSNLMRLAIYVPHH